MLYFISFMRGFYCLLAVLAFSHAAWAQQDKTSKVIKIMTDKQIPATVQKLWRNGFEECTEKGIDTSASLNGFKIQFMPVNPDSGLYILACGGPGYNRPYVAIAYDGEKQIAQRVAFPIAGNAGIGTQFIIYNFVWDNSKRQISSFGKDRGLGDCGTKAIWRWAYPQFDSHFVLINQKTKIDCDGQIKNYPQVWPPKLWPPKGLQD